MILKKWI